MKRLSVLALALACALSVSACGVTGGVPAVTEPGTSLTTPVPEAVESPATASAAPLPLEETPAALPVETGGAQPLESEAPTETAAPEESTAPEESMAPATDNSAAALGITRNNLPRLDGSTSTAPLGVALCQALLGETAEEVADLINFHKTTNSYLNLLHGEADLLIVAEAGPEVYAEKERLDFDWEKEPFATDAFVFLVNERNPVESITVQQARDIYTGRITNWKDLGGEDREIIPLQRNPGAGSQTLMEQMVMEGEAMMEAPQDYIASDMGALMTAVKSYDGSPGAIGYSVYYYAEEMKMARGLKLLQVEGVEPTPDSIRDGEYPLVYAEYVVIPANARADAPNRRVRDWLLSTEGQELVAAQGYVSLTALPVTPRLTPLVGSRYYEDYMAVLLPQDDYGTLVPYAGQRLTDEWPSYTGCLYGLMTQEGKVVTDPVFTSVRAPLYNTGALRHHPLLILGRAGADGNEEFAVAALDGSWCTGFEWFGYSSSRTGLSLFSDSRLTVMDGSGNLQAELPYTVLGLGPEDVEWIRGDMYGGLRWPGQRAGNFVVLNPTADGTLRCLNYVTGEIVERSVSEWSDAVLAEALILGSEEGASPVEGANRIADSLLDGGPALLEKYDATGPLAVLRYYKEDGTPLPQFTVSPQVWQQVTLAGGLIGLVELDTASYFDAETLECVFRTYLGFEAD